jgi:SAM-dependent methyltransferase
MAPALTRGADGIWRAAATRSIDYPDRANAFCAALEPGSFWFNHRNRMIAELVRRFPPAGAIADIGAGNGYASLGLTQAGYATMVIEPGPSGARTAHARGLAPVVCATLEDAGFQPASLEAAGLFDVLEHIEDDERFLDGLRRLLTPRARVYLTVPAFNGLWSSEDDLVGHHRRYSIGALRESLARSGFATEYATYFFAPLPLPLFLLRTLPSRLGLRRTLDPDQTAAELKPASALGTMMLQLLRYEVAVVRAGHRLPFGTSCLAAARVE